MSEPIDPIARFDDALAGADITPVGEHGRVIRLAGNLYDIVHGANEAGPYLVELLTASARQPFKIGRYRDAFVEAEGDGCLIRIHTRTGGGNREAYELENASLQAHPWYVRDADDDFDPTYADFYFRPPIDQIDPAIVEALVSLAQPHVDMGARWQAAIDALKGPQP